MINKNIIELNGHRYDAQNGTLLGRAISDVSAAPAAHKTTKNVDGVLRTKTANATVTVAVPKATVTKPRRVTISVAGPNHTAPHKPQTAKTLMRTAVRKPGASFKKQVKVQGSLQTKVPSLIAKKTSAYSITPQRLSKAHSIPRSPQVSRYGEQAPSNFSVTLAPLAVQAPPTKPLVTPAPTSDNKPTNIFEQAVANATNFIDTKAHRAQFAKKARRHVVSMAGGSLALLLIAGFLTYQHTPALQLKVAAYQAGFGGTMPNLKAAGFTWKGVTSQSGKLTVGLAGALGGNYQLTQQPTNWSSDDMIQAISSVDASGNPNYDTLQAGNTTVYRFSNSSATWVKDGTWFQLTSTNALSDAQVTALATST